MKKIVTLLFLMINSFIYSKGVYSPVYPTTVKINLLNKEKVQEFRIFNTSDKRKNFEVSLKDFDNFGNKSILKDYIKIFPKIFSLNAGESKVIRVMAKKLPENLMGKGEYRGAILVKGLSSNLEKKYSSKDTKGITTSIDVQIDISMGLYLLTGNENEKVEILDIKNKENKKIMTLKNIGNYSYEVKAIGFDKKDNKVSETLPLKIVAKEKQEYVLNGKSIDKIKIYKIEEEKLKLLLTK